MKYKPDPRSQIPNIGRNIKRLRLSKGLTQKQLGLLAETSSIRMIETGRRTGKHSTLEKVARALGVELSDLFRTPPTGGGAK